MAVAMTGLFLHLPFDMNDILRDDAAPIHSIYQQLATSSPATASSFHVEVTDSFMRLVLPSDFPHPPEATVLHLGRVHGKVTESDSVVYLDDTRLLIQTTRQDARPTAAQGAVERELGMRLESVLDSGLIRIVCGEKVRDDACVCMWN